MPISIWIVLSTMVIAFHIVWYFKNKNAKMITAHNELVGYYNECIRLHGVAMSKREAALRVYNFITFNLKESLLDQSIV